MFFPLQNETFLLSNIVDSLILNFKSHDAWKQYLCNFSFIPCHTPQQPPIHTYLMVHKKATPHHEVLWIVLSFSEVSSPLLWQWRVFTPACPSLPSLGQDSSSPLLSLPVTPAAASATSRATRIVVSVSAGFFPQTASNNIWSRLKCF